MATRLYLNGFKPTDKTFAYDSFWDNTVDADGYLRGEISTSKNYDVNSQDFINWGDVYSGRCAFLTSSYPTKSLGKQYVYGPLPAQTVGGTVKGQAVFGSSIVGGVAHTAIVIRIIAGNGTVRGTLLSYTETGTTVPNLGNNIWTDPWLNLHTPGEISLTPVVAQAGDYLVIEIGANVTAGTTNGNVYFLCWDSAASDLIENETTQVNPFSPDDQAINPWIEFNTNLMSPGESFFGTLTNISNNRYYVRAYAITEDGTSYSNDFTFDGLNGYSGPLTDLDENSTYHVRAYAINEAGIVYSDDVPFDVPQCPMDISGTLNAVLAPVYARSGSYIIVPDQYGCDLAALWGFDSNALLFDSVGNNDLTAYNSPTADPTNFQVGDASLALDGTNWASILDNNLDENFPLKLGDLNKIMTITSWFSNFTTSEQTLFAKAGDNGLSLRIFTLYNQLIVEWGYSRGEVKETFYYPRQIKIDQWYHLLLSIDGIRRRLVISLYNLSTKGQNICEFRPSNELAIGTFPIYLGAAPGGFRWNGRIDETRIFNCILPPEAQLRLVYNLYDTLNPALPKPSPLPDKSGWKWNEMFWR